MSPDQVSDRRQADDHAAMGRVIAGRDAHAAMGPVIAGRPAPTVNKSDRRCTWVVLSPAGTLTLQWLLLSPAGTLTLQ